MKRCCLFVLFLTWGTAYAQDAPDTAVIARIREEAFQHSQVMNIAFHLTDASGPRLSNSPGLARAQQWAIATMKQWGLVNTVLEPWGTFGKGWEVTKDYLAMTEPYYQPLIAYPHAWTKGSGGPFTAELVLYRPRDSAEQAALIGTLKGKMILYPYAAAIRFPFEAEAVRYSDSDLLKMKGPLPPYVPPRPDTSRPRLRPIPIRRPHMEGNNQFFEQEGVLGALSSSSRDRDGTVYVQAGGSQHWDDSLAPMRIEVAYEHFHQLQRILEAGIPVTIEGDIETHAVQNDSIGYNVVGEIPGTDPRLKDQLVVLGGHLDSWQSGTGATDNGAGSAVMLEVMRILTDMHVHPRRTIRIILWSGEEQGLLGSTGYIKRHFRTDSVAQSKVSAYYNLDNGSGRIRGVYLQGDTAAGPLFRKWLEQYGDSSATTITIRNTGGTDHLPFVSVGIPGFQFIQDPLEYDTRTHHSNMDTYDHLSPEDLKQAAAIVAVFVCQTAMRDGMVPRRQ